MQLRGTPVEILTAVAMQHPEVLLLMENTRQIVPFIKRQITDYQAAPLYALAKQYNREGARILEIGTAWGYSCAVMAQAAPKAQIVTLNPKPSEVEVARQNLSLFRNVEVRQQLSTEYWTTYQGPNLDMVFVDGDHSYNGVMADCVWFNHLNAGGLILFHDYSPAGSKRATPEVFRAVNDFTERLGRSPDVSIIDNGSVGMVGYYRRENEVWNG